MYCSLERNFIMTGMYEGTDIVGFLIAAYIGNTEEVLRLMDQSPWFTDKEVAAHREIYELHKTIPELFSDDFGKQTISGDIAFSTKEIYHYLSDTEKQLINQAVAKVDSGEPFEDIWTKLVEDERISNELRDRLNNYMSLPDRSRMFDHAYQVIEEEDRFKRKEAWEEAAGNPWRLICVAMSNAARPAYTMELYGLEDTAHVHTVCEAMVARGMGASQEEIDAILAQDGLAMTEDGKGFYYPDKELDHHTLEDPNKIYEEAKAAMASVLAQADESMSMTDSTPSRSNQSSIPSR
jgi:hypothetical protein